MRWACSSTPAPTPTRKTVALSRSVPSRQPDKGQHACRDCPGCRAKPASVPPPDDAVSAAVANYEKVLTGVATHPSHVILILSNENDISGPDGHWGPSPYAEQYACASLYRLALFFWLDVVRHCVTHMSKSVWCGLQRALPQHHRRAEGVRSRARHPGRRWLRPRCVPDRSKVEDHCHGHRFLGLHG